MFNSNPKKSAKEELLEKARLEREVRHCDKRANASALIIQRAVGNWIGKKREHEEIRRRIQRSLGESSITGLELFLVGQQLLFVHSKTKDAEIFIKFCQALLDSMSKDITKAWYVSVVMKQKLSASWIMQVKKILVMSCTNLKELKFGLPTIDRLIKVYMELIVLFTDHTLWKFTEKAGRQVEPMLRGITSHIMDHLLDNDYYGVMHELLLDSLSLPAPSIPGHYLSAAMAIRQLALSNFSTKMMTLFIKSILTVPGLLLYVQKYSPETIKKLEGVKFVNHAINVLHSDSTSLISLDTNGALGVFGNLVHLSTVHIKVLTQDKMLSKLLDILVVLIQQCKLESSTLGKGISCTSWHPFFGWTNSVTDRRVLDMLSQVRLQLQNLWCGELIQFFFAPVLCLTPAPGPQAPKSKIRFSLFRRNTSSIKLDPAILEQANKVCHLYDTLFDSLRDEIKMDVLIGLGCNGALVSKMWHFLWLILGLDVDKIVQAAVSRKSSATGGTTTSAAGNTTTTTGATRSTATGARAAGTNVSDPIFSVLTLCCQTTQYSLIILDDDEVFVQQKQFSIAELLEISSFLNRLVFRLILEGLNDVSFFPHCHSLLMLLHSRDCRRNFTEPDHWLIKNFKISNFMNDLKAGKPRARKLITSIPHVIPLQKRLEVFQGRVMGDKVKLGIPTSRTERHTSAYIDVHRNRILEDGYTQLSSLTSKTLKGTIRVKFFNEQGLDEAGIDETGVFKEFLEEVIKSAFDPHLNLFKVNSQGHLYPSSTSYVQENHLSLFEFVGKMLGKALYEGIVVDVPFAPFFLSQMLEHHFSACYSCLDELPSMDPEMYKSLCFIKHDEGDVSDLCLNFSCDESFLGKVTSHDLVPGGSTIPVTNENRISYVHRMAHFKMYTQIKDQSVAFIRGFHSVIDKSLVSSFSPLELQHLISGNQAELDVDDLRKHTQYLGGYTDSHKVINWLWDIVKNDFTAEEKASFLKFVTSCSKSPLLGFAHLEPPFSIRCVEVPDEEDSGDSVVSVIRGLFSIRRRGARDRLPTASTCFNLLKLPNYTRKPVLKEKLKYALSANAGFELS